MMLEGAMGEAGGGVPSPDVYYAVIRDSEHADEFRLAFGPVYLENLARRALEVVCHYDETFKVRRREIHAQMAHFAEELANEWAMLHLAESDPSQFGMMVRRGLARPIVVRGFVLDGFSSALRAANT